jgi:hypothetical protein
LSMLIAISDIFIQSDFEFVMILIIGSSNHKLLNMSKLAFDRVEP